MNVITEQPVLERELQPPPRVRRFAAFRQRGLAGALVLGPIGLAALFSAPRVSETSATGLSLNAAAWAAFLLYVVFRVWATLFVGGRKDIELQTEGPYSLCRNPLYFGSFCYGVALACLFKSAVFGAAVLAAGCFYFLWVVPVEERFLAGRFGQAFADYCRRTPRFGLRFSAYRSPSFVSVELKRLGKELPRLGRAALLMLALQAAVQLRSLDWWPRWLGLY
jgi:protein-S-isoprenylcysteine O-methyltransferase Ste14